MCRAIRPAGDFWAGEIITLCTGDRVAHVLALLSYPASTHSSAAPRLFGALLTNAETIVRESFYFDLDYRSELAVQQEAAFETSEPSVDRLHFFSVAYLPGERIVEYLGRVKQRILSAEDAQQEGDAADPHAGEAENPDIPTYLGYATDRPSRTSRIGRSLVTTWAQTPFREPGRKTPKDQNKVQYLPIAKTHEQVRTAVPEEVNIFGIDFRAVGVAFMEQDGSLLRCAHVSAWICHYTAVLRGMTTRRSTAQFHRAGNTTSALSRAYPSSGLSTPELVNILTATGLPPDVLGYNELKDPRDGIWADRKELRRFDSHLEKLKRKRRRAKLWV
jgi:hypothetical protein